MALLEHTKQEALFIHIIHVSRLYAVLLHFEAQKPKVMVKGSSVVCLVPSQIHSGEKSRVQLVSMPIHEASAPVLSRRLPCKLCRNPVNNSWCRW